MSKPVATCLASVANILPRHSCTFRPRRRPTPSAILLPTHQACTVRTASRPEPLDQAATPPPTSIESPESRQRWNHTPQRMIGAHGFSLNELRRDGRARDWKVNEDPELLEAAYEKLLGRGGAKLLTDELKWLAVTHKSFDYGRRGFNTRLAFFGRQILSYEAMQWTLASKLDSPAGPESDEVDAKASRGIKNVDKLSVRPPQDMLTKDKVARVAMECGLHDVIRWEPRKTTNLKNAGLQVVLTSSVFAVIGAISLQHGSEVASRVARSRVISKIDRHMA